MPAPALQLEPPAPAPTTIWPFAIAVLSAAALSLALVQSLVRIERSLHDAVLARVSAAGVEGISVTVDGRDVELAGELAPDTDRAALVADITDVEGVRVVRDALAVIDPDERLRESRARFRDALARIDTTALAFEPNGTALAEGAGGVLDALARLLDSAPRFRLRIAGHTDDTGRAEVNVRLSRERAETLASGLVARGIDPARLTATGYGATQPIADNATADGRARNRRIEISYVD